MTMRACATQCQQCPFRPTAAPGWLGNYRPGDVFRSLWHGEPFFCHTRTNYERSDWRSRAMRSGQLCLGGLAAAERWGLPVAHEDAYPEVVRARLAVRDGVVCVDEVVVFEQPREFMDHHQHQPYLTGRGEHVQSV